MLIDIFSGFLGAGKTTLIKKLIREAYVGEKVVLIENEFGEIGVDGGFLREAGVEITEMNSGCICCSLVGDFSKALKEVAERFSPHRILIEPSGVGKLSDVIKAVKRAELNATLNIFCTVVDAKKCKLYLKNFGEFFLDQVENAGCIVLSHTADGKKTQEAVELLRAHTQAPIITTDWEQLKGEAMLTVMQRTDSLQKELETLAEEAHKHHEHGEHCCHHDHEEEGHCRHDHAHGHHHADEVFESWGVETAHPFTSEGLQRALKALDSGEYGQILRAKGIVNGGEVWLHFDYVPEEWDVRTGSAAPTGRLCVIGCDLNKEKLSALFLE